MVVDGCEVFFTWSEHTTTCTSTMHYAGQHEVVCTSKQVLGQPHTSDVVRMCIRVDASLVGKY